MGMRGIAAMFAAGSVLGLYPAARSERASVIVDAVSGAQQWLTHTGSPHVARQRQRSTAVSRHDGGSDVGAGHHSRVTELRENVLGRSSRPPSMAEEGGGPEQEVLVPLVDGNTSEPAEAGHAFERMEGSRADYDRVRKRLPRPRLPARAQSRLVAAAEPVAEADPPSTTGTSSTSSTAGVPSTAGAPAPPSAPADAQRTGAVGEGGDSGAGAPSTVPALDGDPTGKSPKAEKERAGQGGERQRSETRGDEEKRQKAAQEAAQALEVEAAREAEADRRLRKSRLPRRSSPTEAATLERVHQWMNRVDMPARGEEGVLVFPFGANMPFVVCAPTHVCAIRLQSGETISPKGVQIGDKARWRIETFTGGPATSVPYIMLKPLEEDRETNLTIVTDRRTYELRLISREKDYMPSVAFSYPDEQQTERALEQEQERKKREANELPSGMGNIENLDFRYTIVSRDNPVWQPIRVFTDGAKTYVQFSEAVKHDEIPALLAVGPGDDKRLVNYRFKGDRLEVDKVLRRAVLIAGVGNEQQKVEIYYDPENKPSTGGRPSLFRGAP